MVQRSRRRDNGAGSIVYDADAERWIGLIDLGRDADGRRRRTKVRGRTRTEVRDKLDDLIEARDAGVNLLNRGVTFAELAEDWFARGVPGGLSENTVANYRRILEIQVVPVIGGLRVADLRSEHIEAVLDAMVERGMATSTMRLALNLMRRVLRYGQARDVVVRNVAAPVLPRRGRQAERHGLTLEQARALLRVASGDRLGNLVTTSLLLGLRPGEAAGLTWDNVDLEGQTPTITIAASLRRQPDGSLVLAAPKTPTSRRRLEIPTPVVEALRAQLLAQRTDRLHAGSSWRNELGLVFVTEVGTPLDPSNVRRTLARLAKSAGLDHVHPHLLRHAAASLLSAAGVPLEDISDTLGHRSVAVTAQIYRHPLAPVRSAHVKAMAALVPKPA
jgi:integrase